MTITIKTPGKFTLHQNVCVTKKHAGIYVDSDNVSIDMNGYSIFGKNGKVKGTGIVVRGNNFGLNAGNLTNLSTAISLGNINRAVITDITASNAEIFISGGNVDNLIVSGGSIYGISCGISLNQFMDLVTNNWSAVGVVKLIEAVTVGNTATINSYFSFAAQSAVSFCGCCTTPVPVPPTTPSLINVNNCTVIADLDPTAVLFTVPYYSANFSFSNNKIKVNNGAALLSTLNTTSAAIRRVTVVNNEFYGSPTNFFTLTGQSSKDTIVFDNNKFIGTSTSAFISASEFGNPQSPGTSAPLPAGLLSIVNNTFEGTLVSQSGNTAVQLINNTYGAVITNNTFNGFFNGLFVDATSSGYIGTNTYGNNAIALQIEKGAVVAGSQNSLFTNLSNGSITLITPSTIVP